MKLYFDRTAPLYFVREPCFYGSPVEVEETAVEFIADLQGLLDLMKTRIDESGTPEDYDQRLADQFAEGLKELWEEYNEIV